MSSDSQQGITQVLQRDSQLLASLLLKVKTLEGLNALLTSELDPKLSKHCQLANYEQGELTVLTHNALWATQFRFLIPSLMKSLKKQPAFQDLKQIHCKLIPEQFEKRSENKAEKGARLSKESANYIVACAESIQDEKLREMMLKIASLADS